MLKIQAARGLRYAMCVGALGLTACTQGGPTDASTPASLDELVVEDANFQFRTSELVEVALPAAQGVVEVRDAEGRRMVTGGFATDTTLDLRLPLGAKRELTVRAGRGAAATERTVTLGAGR